jgi:hypothetical protein
MCAGCNTTRTTVKFVSPDDVLESSRSAMFALKGYRAECFTEIKYDTPGYGHGLEAATLVAQKPNLMHYDSWHLSGPPEMLHGSLPTTPPNTTFVSDGNKVYRQFDSKYRIENTAKPEQLFTIFEPWEGFYSTKTCFAGLHKDGLEKDAVITVSGAGKSLEEGELCDKIKIQRSGNEGGQRLDEELAVFISEKDHLLRRCIWHVSFDGKPGYTRDSVIKYIDTRPAFDKALFAYQPPAGVTLDKS